ncbi:FkbM family methyltransferase [Natrialbaceae archaeon A-gly3]
MRPSLARTRQHAHRVYHRVARTNYDHELLSRRNRTPAGSFRCYEPLNRHGDDAMLEELAAWCGPADVIYDVGANVGIYALALASDAPERTVVAIEPAPPTVDRLRANVACNDLEGRIDVHACGLGEECGEAPFFHSHNPELSAFDRESATRWGATLEDTSTVPISRLDDLAADLDPPDVLKVDVEGAAPDVLRGGRATLEAHRPTLFLEIHEEGLTRDVPGQLRDVLEDLPYTICEREGYWRCDPATRGG